MDLANKECESKCKDNEDCSFYAVNEANKYCTLFKTCHESDREVPRNRYSIFQKIEIGKRSPTDERVDMNLLINEYRENFDLTYPINTFQIAMIMKESGNASKLRLRNSVCKAVAVFGMV